MDFLEHELEEILKVFREESEEQIQKLNKNLLSLENNPKDYSVISELFREAHSLKGAARMIGLDDIQSIAHKLEDVLGLAKDNRLQITSEIIDVLCKTVDAIASIINESIKTRGKSENHEIPDIIKELEKIVSFNGDAPMPEKPASAQQKSTMPQTKDSAEIKKLITQVRVNIEKLKIFSSSPDAFEEFIFFIKELKKRMDLYSTQRIYTLLEDIKLKVESALRGSGVLLDDELIEIEQLFENFVLLYERAAYTPSEPVAEPVIEPTLCHPERSEGSNCHVERNDDYEFDFIKEGNIQNIINKLNNLAQKINNDPAREIIEKITEIFVFSVEKDSPLNQDMMNIIEESYLAAIRLMNNPQEINEDPSLILQRISVLMQMLKLGAPPQEETPIKVNMPPMRRNVDIFPKNTPDTDENLNKFDYKFGETNTIKTLRVDTQKLDHLVNQVGELIIAKIKAKEHLNDTEKIIRSIEDWYREWSKTKQYFRHIEKYHKSSEKPISNSSSGTLSKSINSFIEENSLKLSGLMSKMNSLYKIIQEDDTRLNLIVTGLEEKIKSVRVLPLATIFHLFPRMVRDIAREKNKEIDFIITGSETSVDKKIIEEIKAPLMHIIRNSIDHGIEIGEERIKNGKQPTGRILLGAYHLENSVLIEVSDDGKGIDTQAIRRKVLQKGLLTSEELEAMSEEQIMNIIFWPGFSTGETVTDISGRGIGLDIVYTKISQLNGKVKVKSTLGKGCKVSIQLPVTMATIKSFLVKVNNQNFAIPTSSIKTTHLIDAKKVLYKEGKRTIIIDNHTVPICSLAHTLEMQEPETNPDKIVVIIVQAEDTQIGFIVDKLIGDQEILHKNLSAPLIRVRNIAGITTLGSGDLCLILNVSDLVKSAYMNFGSNNIRAALPYKVNNEDTSKKNVLVVDDSTTTRILQKNIIKSAGYNVDTAVNGFEALNKLISQEYHIIISDVEMPEMNGFELTERIKRHDKLKEIPVIIVTSLASDEDKIRGLEAGADIYMTKSEFNQGELLNAIHKLLNRN